MSALAIGAGFGALTSPLLWWVAAVMLGAPLGAIGACVTLPGWTGLLARLAVPVGAAVQMIGLPPGRNERITTIGQAIVLTAAAASIGFVIVRFLRTDRSDGPYASGPSM
ncbi:hypothetical protein [Actinomadura soli]|uniref:hypothetical protein n=1 Tax=Actinomadura soli TaxID=2508997 RepID=UPI001E60EE72|nr:hypothetical protein [Actinomadura soli]